MAIKKCLICNGSFSGRRDAKTCSMRCRKRLQKVRISLVAVPAKKQLAKTLSILALSVFGMLSLFLGVNYSSTSAATSSYLNFQARLLNSSGSVVADGNYNVEFKIYDTSSSSGSSQGSCTGDSHCLWVETRTGGNQVRVVDGYLTVSLGSVNAFPNNINWDQQLYLTMNIGGTGSPSWDGEMNPRISLTGMPYAFRAGAVAKTDGSGNVGTLSFGSVTNNPVITLPNETGTVCTTAATGVCTQAGTGFVQLQNATPGIQQTGSFNINGTGIVGTTLLTPSIDQNTASALGIANATATAVNIGNTSSNITTTVTGTSVFKPSSGHDSTAAFQIQNAAGTSALFNADTSNMRLGVDVTYTIMPAPSWQATPLTTSAGSGSLSCNATYYYKISAIDSAGGETPASTEQSITTNACGSNNDTITLQFTGVSGASGYKIYRTTGSSSSGTEDYLTTILAGTGSQSWTDTGAITLSSTAYTAPSMAAYTSTNNSNNLLQLSIGGEGTPTGQVYVSGTAPTYVGTYNENGQVAIQGKYAYVETGGGTLYVADISNPASPATVGSYYVGGGLSSIAVSGSYVYTTSGWGGGHFYIINISNPSSPTLAAETDAGAIGGGGNNVTVEGRYAYVTWFNASGSIGSFDIYDISNPSSPTLVGMASDTHSPGHTIIQGKYAYVIGGGLEIYNISNPSAPTLVGSNSINSPCVNGIAVSGRYAYEIGACASGHLNVFDVSNPASPVEVASVTNGDTSQGGGIYVQGRYAYFTNNTTNKLYVYDISNPHNPTKVAQNSDSNLNAPYPVVVSGRYGYVDSNNGVSIYDLGGAYLQQLEAGGTETGTLQVDGDGQVAGNFNIQGSVGIGNNLQVAGNIGLYGGLTSSGSNILTGGNNLLSVPTISTVVPTGGTSTTWGYEVTAINSTGGETTPSAQATDSGGATLASGSVYNTINWSAVSGATGYKIYRTTAGGTPNSIGLLGEVPAGTTSFVDGGTYSTGGSAPTTNTTGQLTVQGSALFQNTTNSTTAFQIQNAAGTNILLNVDTTNGGAISLLDSNTGETSAWKTNANSLPGNTGFDQSYAATYNGYVYYLGNQSLYYAKLNANGSVGAWNTANSWTDSSGYKVKTSANLVVANGYLYSMGGVDWNNTLINQVFYAKINADGSIGNWTTSSNSLPAVRQAGEALYAYGYLYYLGGLDGTNGENTVYQTTLNPDGSVNNWNSLASMPGGDAHDGVGVANGYIYLIGGFVGSNPNNSVRFAKINTSNGTLSSWSCQGTNATGSCTGYTIVNSNNLPQTFTYTSTLIANGYIYAIGGNGTGGTYNNVWYAKLNSDGTTGAWTTSTNALPAVRTQTAAVLSNDYMYLLGGTPDDSSYVTSVYYTSLARVSVGTSIDLVGTTGQTLSDGGSGGSITAGNGKFVGTLQVQGQASFNNGVSVNGPSNFGQANFQNATDSTSAFKIQNAAGTSLLTADTSNMGVNVNGNVNVGSLYGQTVFSDNFESGNLALWTIPGADGTSSVQSSTVHSGKYAYEFNITVPNAANLQDDINSYSSTPYLREWVYISSQSSASAEFSQVSNYAGYWSLRRDNSTGHVCLYNSFAGTNVACAGNLPTGSWHKVELEIGTGNPGITNLWLDGTNIYTSSTDNNGTVGALEYLNLGDTTHADTVTGYIDDVAVTTARDTNSSSLNVTDTLNVQGSSVFSGSILVRPNTDSTNLFQVTGQNQQAIFNIDTINNVTDLYNQHTIIAPKRGGDNTTAFQVQGSSGSSATLLNADTSNMRLGVDVTYTQMSASAGMSASTSSGGNLSATTAYYYKVTAIDSAGGETASSPVQCNVTTSTNKTINLWWAAVPGASGYRIYRAASGTSCGTDPNTEVYLATVLSNYSSSSPYVDAGSITPGTATPPASGTAYTSTSTSNNSLQLSVGGEGTPTGQVYVGGALPKDITAGGVATGTGPEMSAAQGRYLYVVDGTANKLQVFDISNPASPVDVSGGGVTTGSLPYAVSVQGHYAYVLDYTGDKLQVFDISNPASPVDISGGGVALATGNGSALYVSGHYAYVGINYASSKFQIFDISNPAKPVDVTSGGVPAATEPLSIFVQGRYAYVLGNANNKLQVFDISDPAKPTDVSGGGVATANNPISIYVQGRYAYVANYTGSTLQLFDISNPAVPVDITNGGVATAAYPQSVYIQGRYAYVTSGADKFQVFDISNSYKPADVSGGGVATNGSPDVTAIEGRYAYIANFDTNKLQVFDLGGEYTQQLEAGGAEVGTLQVDSNAQVAGDFNLQGGLSVGQSIQSGGNLGIAGASNLQGPTILAGGKNQLGAPTGLTVTNPNNGLGSLTAGTYYYKVTALDTYGDETTASTEQSGMTSGSNLTLNLSWTAVTGASGYKIYRSTTSGAEVYLTTVTSNSYTNNSVGSPTTATPPTTDTTGQFTDTGSALFKNATNSTTAFQIQNASGSSLLNADTSNMRVSIGSAGTATGQLYVSGSIPSAAKGIVTTGTNPYSVSVQGSYAYVANASSNTIGIYNVSNSAAPVSVGSISTGTGSQPISLYIQGHYAYVAQDTGHSIGIYDISNPAVSCASSCSVGSISTGSGTPYSIYVQGRYAYVVYANSGNLDVFDISNPANPKLAASLNTGAVEGHNVYVQGSYAYVTQTQNNTIGIYNVSNPVNPVSAGSISTGAGTFPSGIYVQGRYAYVTQGGGLSIYDISNPAVSCASSCSVGSIGGGNTTISVYVQGRYAYTVDDVTNKLRVFDISSPASPVDVSSGGVSTGSTPTSVYVQGRYAYVAAFGANDLEVYDMGGEYTQQLEAGGTETGTLQVDSNAQVSGDTNLSGGLTVGGSAQFNGNIGGSGQVLFQNSTNSTTAFQIQNAAGASILNADTTNGTIGMISLSAPTGVAVGAGANTGGSLSGASGATYYYKVSAINSTGETSASSEVSINGQSFAKLAAAGAPTGVAATGTTMGIGNYLYKLTFVSANGETTAGTESAVITTTSGNQNITLTLPALPTGATGIKVYRTAVGGASGSETLITAGGCSGVIATTTCTDSATDAQLSGGLPGSNTATTNTNNAALSWTAVPGATGYRIYRGTGSNTENVYFTSATNSYTDTGSAGTSGSVQSQSSAYADRFTSTGAAAIQTLTNSANAFQIQNSSGSNLLNFDTVNSTLTLSNVANGTNAVLGSDLMLSDTNFSSNWSGSGWTNNASGAQHAAGGGTTPDVYSGFTPVAGITYQITYTFSGNTYKYTDGITPNIGGVNAGVGDTVGSDTNETAVITATGIGPLEFVPTNNFNGKITSVTVQQITTVNASLKVANSTGAGSLEIRASGDSANSFVGLGSGQANTTGYQNTALGAQTLQSNTTGYSNTAVGWNALPNNTTGVGNTALGAQTLQSNTTGYSNVALGGGALYSNIIGSNNIAIGVDPLVYNTNGSGNIAIGTFALESGYDPSNTVAVGNYAGMNAPGNGNVFLGNSAGWNESGNNKLYIANTGTTTPLIYGDFASGALGVNSNAMSSTVTVQGGIQATQLPTPAAPTVTKTTAGSASYSYAVTALDGTGETLASTATTISSDVATLNGSNYNTIKWAAIPGAIQYNIYRTAVSGGSPATTGVIATIAGNSSVVGTSSAGVNDTGLAVIGSTSTPTTNTTGGIKAAGNSLIQGNSASLFQIQNSSGTNLLSADTSNMRISVGNAGTATGQLYVAGQMPTAILGSATLSQAQDMVINGRYMYAISYGSNSLTVFDVSNPASPVQIGSLTMPDSGPQGLAYAGHYVYIANYSTSQKMEVVDVGNPSSPNLVANVATTNWANAVTTSGHYAYVAESTGVDVFDISKPSNPVLVTNISMGTGEASSVYASGGYVYVTYIVKGSPSTGYVKVISTASNTVTETLSLSGSNSGAECSSDWGPRAIYVQGRYAYVANCLNDAIDIFDISNPVSGSTTPVKTLSTTNIGANVGPLALAAEGRYLYVALDTSGVSPAYLATYDISTPTSITQVGSALPTGNGVSLSVSGRYAYLAGFGTGNIQTFDLGGTYTQALEVGSAEASTLQVNNDANIIGNTSISGGLHVGQSAQIDGGLGVNGNATFANAANSSAAFQVQNASGSSIFNVDTQGSNLNLNGNTIIGGSGGSTLFSDGFESGSMSAWTNTGMTVQSSIVHSGTYAALSTYTGTAQYATGNLSSNTNSVYVRAYVYLTSNTTGSSTDLVTLNGTGGNLFQVYITNSGSGNVVCLYNTVASSGTCGTATMSTGAWHMIELQLSVGGSGSWQINLDGSLVRSVSGVNTGTQAIKSVTIGENGAGHANSTNYFDDVYASGSASLTVAGNTTLNGSFVSKDAGNSTTAFQIQNAAGTSLLGADTSNMRVSVGSIGTATGQLYVSGQIPTTSVGSVSTGASSNPKGVFIQGRYAYVAEFSTNTLGIFDVSNPANPVSVGSIGTGTGSNPFAVYVQGRYAYVTEEGTGVLDIFDISSPASPISVGSITLGASLEPFSVYVQGRYAYVSDYAGTGNNGAISIIDVSNPAKPVFASGIGLGTGATPYDTYIQGRYAYVTEQSYNTLAVFDISNPASPVSKGSVNSTGTGPSGMYVSGRYAYVADLNSSTLEVFDISNPASPISVGSASTGAGPTHVFVQGRYAYVTNSSGASLGVFDISNPASPVSVGSITTGTTPFSISVVGRYAYITNTSSNNLQIFDLGGEYTQQLQAGGTETGTLQVDSNGRIAGDLNVQGGESIGNGLQVTGNVGVNGAAMFTNTTNSTSAFQIQNSGGGNLFQVDTTNSNVTINGNNSGIVQTWQTGNNTSFTATENYGGIIANGYIYTIGGTNSSSNAITTVQYAQILANGNVGNWSTTTPLLAARDFTGAAYANGYIYIVGGSTDTTAANAQSTVYYAKVNQNGTLGSWQTNAYALGCATAGCGSPVPTFDLSSVAYNGYLYAIGGQTTAAADQTAVYYAKLNADGSTGAWAQESNSLSEAESQHSSVVANGYLYVLGGNNTAGLGSGNDYTQYAKLNADGTTGTWSTSTNLPSSQQATGIGVANGYIYMWGGEDSHSSTQTASTRFAPLNANGSIGAWSCQGSASDCSNTTPVNSTAMPAGRTFLPNGNMVANGYLYTIGGDNAAGSGHPQTTVYYTSTSRVAVAGSLDLVGVSDGANGNLSEGGTGGSLTAGNTQIVGTLNVQNQANFNQGLSLGGNLNAGGSALFKNSANSAVAFQVQDASGVTVLGINTSSDVIFSNIADGASAIGFTLNTNNTFSTTGDLLLSVQNNETKEFSIDGGGHIVTGGSAPTTTVNTTNLGAAATCAITRGNDTSGEITITSDSGTHLGGNACTITYNKAFATAPNVILTSGNGNSAVVGIYTGSTSDTTTQFDISFTGTPFSGVNSYVIFYHIMQ